MRITGSSILRFATILGLLPAMIWPAFVNRGPFVFSDTGTYLENADNGINRLTGASNYWTRFRLKRRAAFLQSTLAQDASSQDRPEEGLQGLKAGRRTAIHGGRSIYYGALLYLGLFDGRFWLSMLLQASAIFLAIAFVLRVRDIAIWPALLYIGLPLCILSDAPFFASLLLPDLFAGIAILVTAALFTAGRTLRLSEMAWAYGLLSACLLFHDSLPPLVGILFICGAGLYLLRRSPLKLHSCAVLVLALATGLIGRVVFDKMVQREQGVPPIPLPFLSARLVADGPGTTFLKATCPGSGFTLCRFVDQFPEPSDSFIWKLTKEEKGVFLVSPPAIQQRLGREDVRFAVAVFRYDPWGVLRSAVRNSALQLITFPFSEFRYTPTEINQFNRTYPPEFLRDLKQTPAYRGTFPAEAFSFLNYLFVLLALAYLIGLQRLFRSRAAMVHPWTSLMAWVFTGIALSAAICGSASGVFPRYEARIVWLIPLLALLVEFAKPTPRESDSWLAKDSNQGNCDESELVSTV